MAEDRYVRHPACLWRTALDGVLVLAPGAESPHHLSGSGSVIWHELCVPRSPDEIATRLGEVFGPSTTPAVSEVRYLLGQLVEARLVDAISAASSLD